MASKKQKTKSLAGSTKFILGVVALLVVAMIVYFAWPREDLSYRGFPIVKATCAGTRDETCYYGTTVLRDTEYTISFYHHPLDVESVGVSAYAVASVYHFQTVPGEVIIGIPKNAPGATGLAATQVSRILGTRYNMFNFPVTAAISGQAEGLLSCDNATATRMVILFEQQPINAVLLQKPNCIVLAAQDVDQATAVADAFVYHLLQIIPTEGLVPMQNGQTQQSPQSSAQNNTTA